MEATPLDVLWIFIQGEGDLLPLQKAKFFFHHQLEIFFQWKSSVIILVITSLPHSCIVFKIPLKVSLNLKGCVLKARTHICDISFVVNDHNHSVMETHIWLDTHTQGLNHQHYFFLSTYLIYCLDLDMLRSCLSHMLSKYFATIKSFKGYFVYKYEISFCKKNKHAF